MKYFKNLITLCILGMLLNTVSTVNANAQRLNKAFDDPEFQKAFMLATEKFDSLFMGDLINSETEDLKIFGVAYAEGIKYHLQIVYHNDTSAAMDMSVYRNTKKKIKEEKWTAGLAAINSSKIESMSDEDLTIKAKPGETYPYTSDANIWLLLSVNNKTGTFVKKESTNPLRYQKNVATNDRATFIGFVEELEKLKVKK